MDTYGLTELPACHELAKSQAHPAAEQGHPRKALLRRFTNLLRFDLSLDTLAFIHCVGTPTSVAAATMSCVPGVSAVWRLECRRGKTALAGEVTALSCRQSAPYAPWFLILHSGVETFILDGTKFAYGLAGSDATGRRRIPVKVHVLETSTLDLPWFSDSSFWRIFIEHREYIPSPFSKLTARLSVTTLLPYMAIPSCGHERYALPAQENGLGGHVLPAEPVRALSAHRQGQPVC